MKTLICNLPKFVSIQKKTVSAQMASFSSSSTLPRKGCRYLALDMAGHGLSSHRPAGDFYTFPGYVADVRRVTESLQLNKFTIMGHSMGANIAGMFCSLYPEKVDGLVFLDAYGFLPTKLKEIPDMMRKGIDEIIQFENKAEVKSRVYTYEKAVERLQTANPTLSKESTEILLERGLAQVEGGFAFTRDIRVNFRNIARTPLELSLEMLSRIQAPVLVVMADKGLKVIFPEIASNYSSLLTHHEERDNTVTWVSGDHHVHLDHPEVVAPVVSDFLLKEVLAK
ncbi:serine hydrolase-like protein isoform X3 [Synchiropus splendidus]|uniref:serine hydrolase-like protein isoform X3 n=2 Tax=Synchiropus splendidus TaxID=270530 RepID=UPI00237E5A9B|nr:serine hydrolase-like protein isoform X3 [Synchiropus splendidus]